MFFGFFFIFNTFQAQDRIELDLDPFIPQDFDILIPPNCEFEIHYAVKHSNLTHNYVGMLFSNNEHIYIARSDCNGLSNSFHTQFYKLPNNFCISKSLSGIFYLESNSNFSTIVTIKIVSLGSTQQLDFIPIFDVSDTFDFESLREFLPSQKIQLAYFNFAGRFNNVVDINYSVTESNLNSFTLYSKGKKLDLKNLNQRLLFRNSYIGFFLNSVNISSIKTIQIQNKIHVQNRYWEFKQGFKRLSLQDPTLPIVIAIIAAYYLFGIICLIIICCYSKSRLNRIYGSLFGKCMCCCSDNEGYYEVTDYYQSHPRYYYSDYNSCGCRKCQCCYESHCSCCKCYYSCNECLCQCCYERHNYSLFNFLRILFALSSFVTFPIVSFICALHLCNPTLRDNDYETNGKNQEIKYKTPLTLSKFYAKFKLRGKTYDNSKSEIDNFDSSDESNEIHDAEKAPVNQQISDNDEKSYSGSENSAMELTPIEEKAEIKNSPAETKEEKPKVKINAGTVSSLAENHDEDQDANKDEDTPLKPLPLSGARQLSYICSPLAANESGNSVYVQSIQESSIEQPNNVTNIGIDISPLPAHQALPPPNFENPNQNNDDAEKNEHNHGDRSRNRQRKRQHRMSMPTFPNFPEFTPLNDAAVDNFKDILDNRNVLAEDADANDLFSPKKRENQKRRYSYDVWRKSMGFFEPPSNFDNETVEIPENIPSNEPISSHFTKNNSKEEVPNLIGALPLFQADGLSIIIPPAAAEYNGIAPPIAFIDPQGSSKPGEKRRQKKRRASAWIEKPVMNKTNDLSFLF